MIGEVLLGLMFCLDYVDNVLLSSIRFVLRKGCKILRRDEKSKKIVLLLSKGILNYSHF